MFLKLFSSILDSSLRREDAETRWLFVTMLILGDEHGDGVVNIPVEALAARAGLSEESTRTGLARLMSPDPDSASKEEEGKRLIPLHDDHSERGWVIVNWPRYKALANEEERREQLRRASSAYRKRLKEIGKLKSKKKRHQASSSVSEPSSIPSVSDSESESASDSGANVVPIRKSNGRFVPPTMSEVKAYIEEKGLNFDPVAFYAYYESIGWRVGKNPMKKWKAACWTWERKER